jgi:hypothetical protein
MNEARIDRIEPFHHALRCIAELLNASDRGHPLVEAFLMTHGGYFKPIPAGDPEGGYPGRWVAPDVEDAATCAWCCGRAACGP